MITALTIALWVNAFSLLSIGAFFLCREESFAQRLRADRWINRAALAFFAAALWHAVAIWVKYAS